MKKIYLLLIIILGIILIPLNTYALDFTVDNQTYTVSDLETYRDYCYFEKYKPNSADNSDIKTMLVYKTPWSTGRWNCSTSYEYVWYDTTQESIYSSNTLGTTRYYNYYIWNGTNESPTFNAGWYVGNNINNLTDYYNTVDITDISGNTLISSNTTFNDIECKYSTADCQSGGGGGEEPPEPEEPTEINNTDLLIVGLMLISIYIWLKFFKACFKIRKEIN